MSWHHSPEAQQLLAAIKRERPDAWYLRKYDGVTTAYPKYQGDAARRLRAIYNRLKDEALAADDAQFFADGSRGTRFHDLLAQPDADELIDEHLHGVPILGLNAETLSDPLLKRRAA